MDAIRYIVDTLLWLLTLAFVLRFLFQLVRADFRDPMADAIALGGLERQLALDVTLAGGNLE